MTCSRKCNQLNVIFVLEATHYRLMPTSICRLHDLSKRLHDLSKRVLRFEYVNLNNKYIPMTMDLFFEKNTLYEHKTIVCYAS